MLYYLNLFTSLVSLFTSSTFFQYFIIPILCIGIIVISIKVVFYIVRFD